MCHNLEKFNTQRLYELPLTLMEDQEHLQGGGGKKNDF